MNNTQLSSDENGVVQRTTNLAGVDHYTFLRDKMASFTITCIDSKREHDIFNICTSSTVTGRGSD